MTIDQALKERKILITCGTGGVGKTTLSAAIAVRAALLGKRAVVITIDPAKRLATSLGMERLGDQATDLTERLRKLDPSMKGTLHAIIPDTRKTFESFVKDLSPSEAVSRRIIENPIFQILAKEFSGSNEYMALERLLNLERLGQYDTIILDTPPSRNTLAFLHAPRLLAQFFEERLIRWLVMPANRLLSAGMRKAMGLLEKLTGGGFMKNLLDFATDLFEVQANFTANLKEITRLLESDSVGFLMVTTPTPETVPEVRHFIQTIQENKFHFEGITLNRTLGYLQDKGPSSTEERDPSLQIVRALQEREEKVVKSLMENGIGLSARVPELARDVHSVEDLFHVAQALGAIEPR